MAEYAKVYLKGGAKAKDTTFGKVLEVSLDWADLVEKMRTGEIKASDKGYLYFSVLKKRPENVEQGKSEYYLQHSRKLADGESATRNPLASDDVDNDLPF